jgi:hypothetical protein
MRQPASSGKTNAGTHVDPSGDSNLSRWEELRSQMKAVWAERLEAERQKSELEAARAEQDAWASAALDDFWKRAEKAVSQRGEELAQSTGCPIRQSSEQAPPGALGRVRVLELRVGSSVVYLYTHHVGGSSPLVHLAHWPASSRHHHHRMMSFPMCSIARSDTRGWTLRRILDPRDELSIDDLVFRAFELLVLGLSRPEWARLGELNASST